MNDVLKLKWSPDVKHVKAQKEKGAVKTNTQLFWKELETRMT